MSELFGNRIFTPNASRVHLPFT